MTVWNQLFTRFAQETQKLENLVLNRLCRLFGRDKVYFLRDERGHEVDFLVTGRDGYDTYRVCKFINDESAEREFRPRLRLQKRDSDARGEKNRFCLVYLKDLRKDKSNPAGIECINLAEFLLFEI